MKVGLSGCSNGHVPQREKLINKLCDVLKEMDIEVVKSPHLFMKTDIYSGSDEERAADLMNFYKDDSIDAIYDITGGDLANGVLKYLDFDFIKSTAKTFWGYSDLTTIINSIYSQTGKESMLYQVMNMVYADGEMQQKRFLDYITSKNQDLLDIDYKFLSGESMEGVVVGGNLRCLAKLAGTKYFPDMQDKILMVEILRGDTGQMATKFAQLELMGVFEKVNGVILGTFTDFEKAEHELSVYDLLRMHTPENLPVIKTDEIGHYPNSKGIVIGRNYKFSI